LDIAGANHGTLQGGALANATGLVGSAFVFDGTNGFVSIPAAPALQPTNVTIEAWVNFDGLDSARRGSAPVGNQYLVFKQNTRTSWFEGYSLEKIRDASGDVFSFTVASSSGVDALVKSTSLIATGVWYHVAAVRGSNYLQLYVNGQLQGQTNVAFAQNYGTQPIYFGTSGSASWDAKLKGRLDEVSIYSRALSGAEIADIYTAGAAGKCKQVNITSQPQSQTVIQGTNAIFSVAATGFGPVHYQWRFDGANIEGANSNTLLLSNVRTLDAGSYDVAINDSKSSATSTVAVLTVLSAPLITSQPQSLIVTQGEPAAFTVAADGSAPIAYQWFLNGVPLFDDGNRSGSTTDSLAITNASVADSGTYSVVISNAVAVTSATASLSVLVPPSIRTQPRGVTAVLKIPTNINFTVTVSGTSPFTYQWYFGNVALTNLPGRVTGTTTNTLRLQALQVSDEGDYWVRVSNSAGTVDSQAAHLTLKYQPQISSPPDSRVAITGDSVSLSVQAYGPDSIGYQWSFNGTPLSDGARVSGANSPTLLLSQVQSTDQGTYAVRVENGYGATNVTCTLDVVSPPAVVSQSGDYGGPPGSIVHLYAGVQGSEPIGYRWQKDAIDLADGAGVSGSSTTNLTIASLSAAGEGTYRLVATNAYGSATSAVVKLWMVPVLAWGLNSYGQTNVPSSATNYVALAAGTTYTLALRDDGTVAGWGNNGGGQLNIPVNATNIVAIAAGDRHCLALRRDGAVVAWGAAGSATTIPADGTNIVALAAGRLHSVALNGTGRVLTWGDNSRGQLNVPSTATNIVAIAADNDHTVALRADGALISWGDLSMTNPTEATNIVAVATGYSHILALRADGALIAWGDNSRGQTVVPAFGTNVVAIAAAYFHNVALLADGTVESWGDSQDGVENVPSVATNAVAISAGNGFCVALLQRGAHGETPVILGQPADQTAPGGSAALFTVNARNPGIQRYQWFFNGLPLAGETKPWLMLTNAAPDQAGEYQAVVENESGAATSALAQLTISDALRIAAQPVDRVVVAGAAASFNVQAGGVSPWFYQWLKDGAALVDDGRIAGANAATLTVSGTQTDDNGQYYVVITNSYTAITSAAASLSVLRPPAVVSSPSDNTNLVGGIAVFTMAAEGTAPLGYRWRFNGAALSENAHYIGVATPSLLVSNVQMGDAGNYSVVITNAVGALTSSAAALTVWQPPTITRQPLGRSVVPGFPAVITVAASGTPAPSYQWRFNGNDIPGATNTSYNIASASPELMGAYTAMVTNPAGATQSVTARLTAGTIATWQRTDSGQDMVPPELSNNVVTISGGAGHILALRSDGTVRAWGNNAYGQTNVPAGLSNVVSIAAGGYSCLALRGDGSVVGWGDNRYGQLNVPATLSNVAAIATSGYHSLALRADGYVVGWGLNTYGEAAVPASIRKAAGIAAGRYHSIVLLTDGTVVAWGSSGYLETNVPPGLPPLVAVSAGLYHSLALAADGSVFAWGLTNYGLAAVPPAISNVVAVSAGDLHNLALRADGTVAAWGRNDYGQINVPPGLSNIVEISASENQCAALLSDGSPLLTQQPVGGAFYTGRPLYLKARASGTSPVTYQWRRDGIDIPGATNEVLAIPSLASSDQGLYDVVASNSLGVAVSAAVPVSVRDGAPFFAAQMPATQTNDLSARVIIGPSIGGSGPLQYQWFLNGEPMPGATGEELRFDPASAADSGSYTLFVSNALGSALSAPLKLKLSPLRTWGYLPVAPPSAASNIVSITGGSWGYFALRSDGMPVSGFGEPVSYIAAPLPSNLVAVAAGYAQAVGLHADGTLVAWNTKPPIRGDAPPGFTNITAVAAGYGFSLALRTDGTVAGWGTNTVGQLNIPTRATNVVAIAAGYQHSLALRSDGTVVAWGYNNYGQAPPQPLTFLSNVVAIAAGYNHSVALKADGTITSWGLSSITGTNLAYRQSNFVAIAAGGTHTLALRNDGTVAAWGQYPRAQSSILPPDGMANVIQIACAGDWDVALFGDRRPYFTLRPAGGLRPRGANATLIAKVAGPQPVSYQWQFEGTDIGGATSDALSLTNLQFAQSGAYQLVASNLYGLSTSAVARLTVTLPLGEALNATNLAWNSTAGTPWYGQPGASHDGVAAARSYPIKGGQDTLLQTTVIGPGQLSFWWKASSETNLDLCQFLLDTNVLATISGDSDWQQRAFSIPAGTRSIAWRYAKNSGLADGQDAAWLDEVVFVPDPPAIITQPTNWVGAAGAEALMAVVAVGSPPLTYQWRKDGIPLEGGTNATLTFQGVSRVDRADYAAVVSNPGGSITSILATLQVLVPQKLAAPLLNNDGSMVVTATASDGVPLTSSDLASFEAQSSTNMLDWQALPGALSLTNGSLQLRDPDSATSPVRYYRIVQRP
jgi:alpha-tubulin suppressor-like RCC1 family protein